MPITIPPIPDDLHPGGCWRRTVTGLDEHQTGGSQIRGEWLQAGDVVELPAGTLVLTVDKKTTGWNSHHHTEERYPVQEATVAVLLAGPQELTPLWSRHYKRAASAFGATTIKKLTALLQQHPPVPGEITVLQEARRPNLAEQHCRWCQQYLAKGQGHTVGRGETQEFEHFTSCPPLHAVTGTPCALCGVTVVGHQAQRIMVRTGTGTGVWEVRHRPHLDGTTCLQEPYPSHEEHQAAQRDRAEAERAAREKEQAHQRKLAQQRDARRLAKEAKEQAEAEAEAARIRGLEVTDTQEQEVTSKNVGPGGCRRAYLLKCTDTLSDGTTTLRWAVRVQEQGSGWTGEDYDPDPGTTTSYRREKHARWFYRSLVWEQPTYTPSRGSGRDCDNCQRGGGRIPRRDSSGLEGVVCRSCNEDADYMLSFA